VERKHIILKFTAQKATRGVEQAHEKVLETLRISTKLYGEEGLSGS
jgi:hypothetical protein